MSEESLPRVIVYGQFTASFIERYIFRHERFRMFGQFV